MEATAYEDTHTPQEQWECTKIVLCSHFMVELPTVSLFCLLIRSSWKLFLKIWLFHPVAETLGMATWQVPFPSWKAVVLQNLLFFSFEDFSLLGYVLPCEHLRSWPWCDVAFFSMLVSSTSISTKFTTSILHLLVLQLNMPIPLKSWSLEPVPYPLYWLRSRSPHLLCLYLDCLEIFSGCWRSQWHLISWTRDQW